jgi:HK97 family phage major capsid protein
MPDVKNWLQSKTWWEEDCDWAKPFVRFADEIKALSVGSDPDGGYTVTPDMSGRIVEKIFETSPMRQVASVQAINSDALEGLYDLDEASSGWVSETGSRTATNTPNLAQYRIPTHEQYALAQTTQKLIDDSSLNIEAWLSGKVQDKFARTENAAFVNGDGSGKPRGFLTYGAGTTLPGTIEQKPTGASGAFAGSGAGGDTFYDMVYALKAGYRNGARWAMNRSTIAAVRKIKDSDGNYVWQMGLAAGQPSTLAGYPIVDMEDMPDIGADSLSIAFANWGEAYQIVDRLGTRILRDPYSNKPYIQLYVYKRTGGDVLNFEAIKLMKFGS